MVLENQNKILMKIQLKNNYFINFVNLLMLKGKKSVSQKIIFLILKEFKLTKQNPYKILTVALYNLKPILETKKRRKGRIFYDIPFPIIRKKRQWFLATKWLIQSTRVIKNISMFHKLINEIIKCSKRQGLSFKKKIQIYALAKKNRPFLHFRWH